MKTSQFTYRFFGLLVLVILTATGCKINDTTTIEPSQKTEFTDLQVNPDFKFETTKEVNIHLEIATSNPQEPTHKFEIYAGDPDSGGKLMATGVTSPYNSFQTSLNIPTSLSHIYVINRNVNGETEKVAIDASENNIYYSFNSGYKVIENFKSVSSYLDPGCSSCDEIVSGGTYNKLTIENNTVYCIEAGTNVTVTNKIEFKGGSLYVCGNLTVDKIQATNSGGDFVLSTGGTMNLSNGNIDKDLDNFISYGTASISGQVTINDMNFENHSTMNISGGVNIQTEDFLNNGLLNIAGSFNNNEEGVNSGTMNVSGHFNNNGNSVFTNECKLIITGNFNQNNEFENSDNAYVSVGQNTNLNGSSETIMGAQSMISTTSIHINDELIGPDVSCARIEVSQTTNINGSGDVSGHIDICDDDGIENNNGTIGNDVTFDCSCYIPTTNCNPGGGQPTVSDTDGDGVPDDQDDYPNDPDRCTNDYYPNATDYTTLAFEDLWYSYGDYDFNDLVVKTNYKIVKNAQNEIVELYGKYQIAAAGASMNNGFGVEFDFPSSIVSQVTGTQIDGTAVTLKASGIEDGPVNKAVMIVYDAVNDYLGTSMVNTIPGGNSMEIDTIEVYMSFTSPQATIGTAPFNPFMFISQVRGKEIHLIDHAPTELVDASYFGEGEDNSDPTVERYYVSDTYLPWVIEIPVSFKWPIENADILSAYLKFQQWAESSGTDFTDWYEDNPGYRDDNNIY